MSVSSGKPNRRWLAWTAALASASMIAGGILLIRERPTPEGKPTPRATETEEQRPILARAADAKLLPMPGTIASPSIPRWGSERKAEEVADRVILPNGTEAVMFAGKPSYPSSAPIDLHLQLFTPDGEPMVGRADLTFTAFDSFAENPEPITLNFMERYDEPGTYDANVAAPKSWKRVTVLLPLNERGSVDNPGEHKLVQVQVDHSAPATLVRVAESKLSAQGTLVKVLVRADRVGRATVRAELRDGEGQSFGDTASGVDVKEGPGVVELLFPALNTRHPSASHAFYLMDLTLLFDDVAADFRRDPVPIQLQR